MAPENRQGFFVMRNLFKKSNGRQPANWRDFQDRLKLESRRPWFPGHPRMRATLFVLVAFLALWALCALPWYTSPEKSSTLAEASLTPASTLRLNSKQDILRLFTKQGLNNLDGKFLNLPVNDQILEIETTLNPGLQDYLLNKMDRKNSRYIGIVVMEGNTGRILALAGFDKKDPDANPCLRSKFPAASIFKIVTAAAAVDHCGLDANSKMHFNGYKHTLYKRQLKEKINRYTNTISLKNAFAQSVNPVFGKIGKFYLGGKQLEEFADAFGFNTPLDFELPHGTSYFRVEDRPYNWAEMASGFNNDTTLSPLHGAVMASAIMNEGHPLEPSIVDRIQDPNGATLYHWHSAFAQQAMSPEASSVLCQLMQTTISSGTGRRSFRGYKRDRVLSHLQIGGKTGTIDNRKHNQRFDWFVGFAREKDGGNKLAIAVMVAHQEYIGIRASRYARMAMKYYFQNCLPAAKPGQQEQNG